MATITQPHTPAPTRDFPQSSVKFDWMVVLLEALWVGGVFVDGWAHAHGKVDQSFFTPWHAILYTGFFVNAVFFAGVAWRNHTRGYSWGRSVPRGYEFAVLGSASFSSAVGSISSGTCSSASSRVCRRRSAQPISCWPLVSS